MRIKWGIRRKEWRRIAKEAGLGRINEEEEEVNIRIKEEEDKGKERRIRKRKKRRLEENVEGKKLILSSRKTPD
jgi:hypothetical protein